ncbi:MAG: membrane fusion protein (multidrug efflux system), partial [Parvicellaceae bacterium]
PGTIVVNIINSGSLEVECPVSPDEINLIKIGNEVQLSDDQEHVWTGVVSRKGQYLNPNTQSIPVFIQLNTSKEQLYNGMYVTAKITGDSIPNVYEIPRRALVTNEAQVYVEKNSILLKKPIDIVAYKSETVLVGGLENGEHVIIEPLLNVKDSMKVVSIAD